MDSDERGWGGTGGRRGKRNYNQDILGGGKNLFSIKGKKDIHGLVTTGFSF